ncbi:MAG: hypothetical protein OEQ74_02290 [Gammaproteobacteria bacterium]|nr:hypothetical protein [Gammaproteobacteria bacterium]
MRFYLRKSRRNKKTVVNKNTSRQRPEAPGVARENPGYDPYDTMPGVPRDKFGMYRRADGKWSF